jgi:tetratricopeptide (TPR) repeat protein
MRSRKESNIMRPNYFCRLFALSVLSLISGFSTEPIGAQDKRDARPRASGNTAGTEIERPREDGDTSWSPVPLREIAAAGSATIIEECNSVLATEALPPTARRRWYEMRADAELVADKLSAALSDYDSALRIDSKSARLLWKRSRALGRLGRVEEMGTELESLLKAHPDFSPAYVSMALLRTSQSDYTAAHELLDKAMSLNPNSSRAYYARAVTLYWQQKYRESAEATEKSIVLDPYPDTDLEERYLNCAACYLALEQSDKALGYLHLAHRINPKSYLTTKALFSTYIRLDRPRAAQQYGNLLREIRPNDVETCLDMVKLYTANGDGHAALREAERASALSPNDPNCVVVLADAHFFVGDYAKAFTQYDRALQLSVQHTGALLNKAAAACLCPDSQWTNPREALLLLDKLAPLYHDDKYKVNYLRALALAQLGKYEQALPPIQEALRQCPKENRLREKIELVASLIERKTPITEKELQNARTEYLRSK